MSWCWHGSDATEPKLAEDVLAYPVDLKLLETARDVNLVKLWRARAPDRKLIVRHTFGEHIPNNPGVEDVQRRVDMLCQAFDAFLPYGPVIAETPWNEELQENAEQVKKLAGLSVQASRILKSRGYQVAAGGFGVTWPPLDCIFHFGQALTEADYAFLHTYFIRGPQVTDWLKPIAHASAVSHQWLTYYHKHTLITEFGWDYGLIGIPRSGWLDAGISEWNYASYLREARAIFTEAVVSVAVFCSGGRYGWSRFEVAGRTAIRQLFAEVSVPEATYEFVFGVKAMAERMVVGGYDPGVALEPERYYLLPNGNKLMMQKTTTGYFYYDPQVNQPWFAGSGRVYLYNGGNILATVPGL